MINSNGEKINPTDVNAHDDAYETNKTESEWKRSSFDPKSVISLEEFEIDAKHSVAVNPGFLR